MGHHFAAGSMPVWRAPKWMWALEEIQNRTATVGDLRARFACPIIQQDSVAGACDLTWK